MGTRLQACTLINAADHEGDGRSGGEGGGGSRSSGLSELARVFPAACSGDTISATHRYAMSTHDLLRKLLGVVPSKVILTQPAARADSGDTQHFSAARRVCVCSSFRIVNTSRLAQDDLVDDDLWKQNIYFYVRCFDIDGGFVELGVSGRSRSRSVRYQYGSLQNGYGRGSGYTHRSGNCCRNVLLALGTLSGTRLRYALLFPRRIGENGYARERMRLANRR